MTTSRKALISTASAAALAVGLVVTGPPQAAHATPADCERGANGFVDIPDDLSGRIARERVIGGGTRLTLEYGSVAGAQRGWAKISGWTLPGDSVWMDWTTDGGRSWLQCGPFVVRVQDRSYTSAAKNTRSDPNWRFRACASLSPGNKVFCTEPDWW